MPARERGRAAALEDLADALQAAVPLVTRQRRDLGDRAQDAQLLEGALARAVRACQRLRSRRLRSCRGKA